MGAQLVEWQLTRQCNLNCRHCNVRRETGHDGELSPAEALTLADSLAHGGCESIAMSGGEPLLREDWPHIARRLSGHGVSVQMISNGSLLTPDTAQLISDTGVSCVLLSLDGMGPAHDRIRRRPGSFREVLSAADNLETAGVRFGFITTLLRDNLNQLEPVAQLVCETGAVLWQVWMGNPPARPGQNSSMWLSRRHTIPVRSRLAELSRTCAVLVPGDNLRSPTTHRCPAGTQVLGVSAEGRVRGCLALGEEYSVGSVRRQDPETLCEAAVNSVPSSGSSCPASRWITQQNHTAPIVGTAAAALLLATTLAGGCNATTGKQEPPTNTPSPATPPPASTEPLPSDPAAQQPPPALLGPPPLPSEMPPCCLSHMLIPGCKCNWGATDKTPDGGE